MSIILTWYADSVVAFEVVFGTLELLTVQLVASIATLGLTVADPALWQTPVAVGAPEPVRPATRPQVARFLVGAICRWFCNQISQLLFLLEVIGAALSNAEKSTYLNNRALRRTSRLWF